ncbi:11128_t:CDS:1 [Ambispora gerdemannii]|uniref:11128_t:CDS:1 n=1 Tax=Ambispora gerdemannii TaxID=144530 RepID=A0A9N9CBT4_9GLOM|nr:11128_t:CDS:1 [Ambispora gerdemannii]
MATIEVPVSKVINTSLNPVPQYILSIIPAVLTAGAAPKTNFIDKLIRVAQCLSCPFIGLFYTCNVKNDEITTYWLRKCHFMEVKIELKELVKTQIPYKPVGHHAMTIIRPGNIAKFIEQTESNKFVRETFKELAESNKTVLEILEEECVANASVLERLSSLTLAYYILIGIISGIMRLIGPIICEDWPYIPLAFCWTLPAIYRRSVHGRLLVKDPEMKLKNNKIYVIKNDDNDNELQTHIRVVLTALASITVPWISVFLAYLTPPIGFYCRSKYLAVLCSIWSLNNLVAYIHHWVEEKNKTFDHIVHIWFTVFGVIVAMLLFVLALLISETSWWVSLFGQSCDVSGICPV